MFEPLLVALTSTPSIVVSSVELTRPVSAATGACADAADGNATAKATPTAATSGWCMVPPGTAVFCQHRLCRLRAASLPSDGRAIAGKADIEVAGVQVGR